MSKLSRHLNKKEITEQMGVAELMEEELGPRTPKRNRLCYKGSNEYRLLRLVQKEDLEEELISHNDIL